MIALFLALLPQTTAESKMRVEAAAVLVVRDVGLGENEVGPFNQNDPGTKVALLVTSPAGGILSLDDDKSKLTSMKDDKGTDLLAAKPRKESFGRSSGIWPFPKIGKDGKTCVIEVSAAGLPAKGAKSIALQGTLSLVVAQGQETIKQADVKLQKGTKIKAGELELEVGGFEKSAFNDEFPLQLNLSGSKGGRKLAKVRFLDAAGKEIESMPGGTSRMSGFGSESYTWSFHLKSEIKAATVEVTLWKQMSDVQVPVKLEVSLGL